jgi:two-component system, NtrC family, nitrogen regulation sensor histidine kinase NtrY
MTASGKRDDLTMEREKSKRRRERWAIGVVAVLIAGLTLLEANIAALGGSIAFSSNIVIFALINLNVILIVLLIFLVTRNLFKLILDRRRNILGAKIRSRLVLIFILFSLLPTILLFVAAANITTTSIKSWIGGRVGVALTGALEIVRKGLEDEAHALAGLTDRAAGRVAATSGSTAEAVRSSLDAVRDGAPEALFVADGGGIVAVSGALPRSVSSEILSRLKGMEEAAGHRAPSATMVGDTFTSAARRLPDGRVVVAVRTLPEDEARTIRDIARAYDEYHQVRLLDDPIRTSYIAILVLITLLIVFAASWMGIYLAKQITVPVQLLAEGTQEVASGNLDIQLDYRSDDEFGSLVASFNRMTADIREMKRDLTGSNLSLSVTYEELRRRTQLLEAILTNISTGVIFVDRNGRIATINRVAGLLLGIETERAIGKLYRDVVRVEHYEAVRTLWKELGESPDRRVERQLSLPVGARDTSLRVSLIALHDGAGEYRGMVVTFDDLTQTLRLQKVMAWREVARRIAHEIRNPLTPIQLSAERLQRRYAADHARDPAFAECTQTIVHEVGTIKHLVEEFTRFARMPAPVFKEANVAEVLRPVVETYRSAHPGIAWEFDAGDVPPAWFDPFQIHRAVTNLLENAAAALGGAGKVSIRCDYEPELGLVRIIVADDGPGIRPEDRNRLFEPYFSRKEGGTGLGLAIVSTIADDHHGTVRVLDNVPRGAAFEIEFPARPRGRVQGV